jgi:uncharacterized protein YggE
VHDFGHLGDLVAELALLDMTDVGGPRWSLSPDSQIYRDTRVEAVHDAVRRAREYAGALGAELTGLVDLADTGLGIVTGERSAVRLSAGAASGISGPEQVAFDVVPVRQKVTAQVEARFTMSAPDLM